MRPTLSFWLAAALAATYNPTTALAQTPAAPDNVATDEDPYLWLEDVEGEKALAWVRERNEEAKATLAAQPGFAQLEADLLAILDSDARIPGVVKIGPYLYNFWRDRAHPAGLWRRTTLEEYRKAEPAWQVLIDLDAVNKAEGLEGEKKWVWHGADCLKPDYLRSRAAARMPTSRASSTSPRAPSSTAASSGPRPRARSAGSTATTCSWAPTSAPAR
jgi:prolyl oligopeptidase